MSRMLSTAVLISVSWSAVCRASAQEATAPASGAASVRIAARFAEPVLLRAGGEPMGARRLYPSPVLHDANGDGRADIVLGDLWGRLTVALRLEGSGPPRFGPDEPLLARDGERLDFHNW